MKEEEEEYEKSTDDMYMTWTTAITKAAKTTLPIRKQASLPLRDVSARTRRLFDVKANTRKCKHTTHEYSAIQDKIRESSLQDFRDWVRRNVEDMERANDRGDVKRIYALHNHLAATPKPPPRNLVTNASGALIKSSTELAAVWADFLQRKFESTDDAESNRPPMADIPTERYAEDDLQRDEFDVAVSTIPDRKAVGPDGVPAEAFKYSKAAKDALFDIMKRIWDEEKVPVTFAKANFKMIFKKSNSDDPRKYRCLGMLNHCYKVLSRIILGRLTMKGEKYLQDWQAGFRQGRGCRDNSYILRVMSERMLQLGEQIAITFIDFTVAFDSISHKFLDEALREAGALNNVRVMFRAVYVAASAHTTVPAPGGATTKSNSFVIRRGVVQGDITSPLYFILALESILRRHDKEVDKGVSFGDVLIHTLDYREIKPLCFYLTDHFVSKQL